MGSFTVPPELKRPKGDVIATSPAGGVTLRHGKTVVVFISSGQPLEVVTDVVGESYTEAVVLLKGFVSKEVRKQTSQAAPGTVIAVATYGVSTVFR